jgi:hypothetical protein
MAYLCRDYSGTYARPLEANDQRGGTLRIAQGKNSDGYIEFTFTESDPTRQPFTLVVGQKQQLNGYAIEATCDNNLQITVSRSGTTNPSLFEFYPEGGGANFAKLEDFVERARQSGKSFAYQDETVYTLTLTQGNTLWMVKAPSVKYAIINSESSMGERSMGEKLTTEFYSAEHRVLGTR